MPLDIDIFGMGIYSPRQAARLIGSRPDEVRRWTRGSGPTEPLWNAYYQDLDDTAELSFSDLIEVRAVKALKRAGLSTQAIRFAINLAEEKFGVERPLSNLDFKTDGQEILAQAVEEDGELVSLSKKRPGQKVFSKIVEQSVRDLEYEGDRAARWRPQGAKDVVIDPARQFGTPILDEFGISTTTLYQEFLHFKDERYLAKIYEIPLRQVNTAIRYEKSLDDVNG